MTSGQRRQSKSRVMERIFPSSTLRNSAVSTGPTSVSVTKSYSTAAFVPSTVSCFDVVAKDARTELAKAFHHGRRPLEFDRGRSLELDLWVHQLLEAIEPALTDRLDVLDHEFPHLGAHRSLLALAYDP